MGLIHRSKTGGQRTKLSFSVFAGLLTLALVSSACVIEVTEDTTTETRQTETTGRDRGQSRSATTATTAADSDDGTEPTMPEGFEEWQKANQKFEAAAERWANDPEDVDALADTISTGDRSCGLLPDEAPAEAHSFCDQWKDEVRPGYQEILDVLRSVSSTSEAETAET